jgi:dimethylhistidine N-methyltransferase
MNVHINRLQSAPLLDPQTSAFALDALEGLTHTPKTLSPKYFYDAAGSDLFEQITLLPEYYPTRTELGILRDRGAEIAKLIPKGAALVEFGAGATTKVRLLLQNCAFAAYVPVDISGEFLGLQANALRKDFPDLAVHPVIGDFTKSFELPADVRNMPKVGFFPGSTIGNFEPEEASRFLCRAAEILGKDALLILGVDLEKDEGLLHAAYNDAADVTAKFNLNLLVRMNRELGANFDASSFAHRAVYNRRQHRIEMHLFSRKAQKVRLCGRTISFAANESIHTENSYKYSIPRLAALAKASGWRLDTSWTDANGMFSVHALRSGV